jgi:hypothetical protein
VTDPLIAEVLDLRDGVIFAELRVFSYVVMEMDSLEVVNSGIHVKVKMIVLSWCLS